jgi:hypothetical protein
MPQYKLQGPFCRHFLPEFPKLAALENQGSSVPVHWRELQFAYCESGETNPASSIPSIGQPVSIGRPINQVCKFTGRERHASFIHGRGSTLFAAYLPGGYR